MTILSLPVPETKEIAAFNERTKIPQMLLSSPKDEEKHFYY